MAEYIQMAKLRARLETLRERRQITSEQNALLTELQRLGSDNKDIETSFQREGMMLKKSILGPASGTCNCCGRTL